MALFFLVHKTQFMSVDSKTTSITTQLTAYTTSLVPQGSQRTATVPIPYHGALRIPESLEHGSEVNDCRHGKRTASLRVNSCGWHVGDETHDHELQTGSGRCSRFKFCWIFGGNQESALHRCSAIFLPPAPGPGPRAARCAELSRRSVGLRDRCRLPCSRAPEFPRIRVTRPGMPTTVEWSGTEWITTEPAPTLE